MRKGKLSDIFQKRIHDTKEIEILILSAKRGSQNAARAARAFGLATMHIVNGEIVEKEASGKIKVIRKIKKIALSEKSRPEFKKGMTLCRR